MPYSPTDWTNGQDVDDVAMDKIEQGIASATTTAEAALPKAGGTMTGTLTMQSAKVVAGTTTDVLGSALEVVRNGVTVGRVDNNGSNMRVQAQNGVLQLRGTGNNGMSVDSTGLVTFDKTPAVGGAALGGGYVETLPPLDTNCPILPGRPMHGASSTFAVPANFVFGTVFKMSEPADLYRILVSVSTAAPASSIARVWVASWAKTTGVATLVRDFGTVAIDSAAAEGIDINNPGAAGDLAAGEYVICFVPNAAVTMRVKNVYDSPFGAQNGTGIFNAGGNRILAAPYNQQGSFPGAALSTVTLTPGVSIIAPTCYALTIPKFQ